MAECDGFNVLDDFSGETTEYYRYDANGDLQQINYHASMQDRIYNSATGYEVSSMFVLNDRYDPENDVYYGQGVFNNITVPGYGLVRAHVGHYIVDGDFTNFILEVGHQIFDNDLLCEAMNQSP